MESISGSIERITFHNSENGFCILRIKLPKYRELQTVIGNAASIVVGEYISATGEWVHDKHFGMQFRSQELKILPPNTVQGIKKFLASGLIKGIGPHYAEILVNAFGTEVFHIIDTKPETLLDLPGLGKKRLKIILTHWQEQKSIREIMIFLQSHGIGTARAVRIYKKYQEKAIELLKNDPYRLASDISGIGFKTADELATKLGIAKDSPLRAQAGLLHVLQLAQFEGHCFLPKNILLEQTQEILEIDPHILVTALSEQCQQHRLISVTLDEQEDANNLEVIYSPTLYAAEKGIVTQLKRLSQGKIPWGNLPVESLLTWVQRKTQLQLSPSQQQAVQMVLQHKIGIITGGPGVGKTTIVKSILKILQKMPLKIALCAPTGRAAKRLSETTGMLAKTIHRLLEFDPSARSVKYSLSNPLSFDLVIIDETSMIDTVLMSQLLKAIPSAAAVLLIGDVDQLPSVGPGMVLTHLIASQTLATVRLTEIFRQVQTSRIITNAHRVNQGLFPLNHIEKNQLSDFYFIEAESAEAIQEKVLTLITERIPKRFQMSPLQDIQLLTPMNKGLLGTHSFNERLQKLLNKNVGPSIKKFGNIFGVGDKVIQTVNNYEKEVFNGDMGIITTINSEDKQLSVLIDGKEVEYNFLDLDELQLAYAITIHKSQGSEYPVVVIPLAMQHFMMLARNLLYTGMTRGKSLVVLVGEIKAVAMAIKNSRKKDRFSYLKNFLTAESSH